MFQAGRVLRAVGLGGVRGLAAWGAAGGLAFYLWGAPGEAAYGPGRGVGYPPPAPPTLPHLAAP